LQSVRTQSTIEGVWWRFAKSVLAGGLVGAAVPLCLTIPLAIDLLRMGGRPLAALYLASLPLIVSFALALPSSVVIGIPIALVLRSLKAETTGLYVFLGATFGVAVPAIVLALIGGRDGYWLCIFGLFGGAATGFTWGRGRESPSRSLD
jgi:hypothetical protein